MRTAHAFPAQTPTLNITQSAFSDTGNYTVKVSNDCGATTSLPGILTLDPDLQIFSSAGTVTLIWADLNVVLEQADSVNGPWALVRGTTSPFHPAALGPAKFFRLQQTAP